MPDSDLFSYRRTVDFDVPVEELWAALHRVDLYQSWWPWFREVVAPEGLQVGEPVAFTVVSPLPYRMRLEVTPTEAVPHETIAARIRGDLEGTGSLRFHPLGGTTRVEVTWEVEARQRGVKLAARVTRPLLLWGQGWAMAVAVRGFRRYLDAPP